MPRRPTIASVFASALVLSACDITIGAAEYSVREQKTFTVNGPVRLALTTFDGSVNVRGWDRNEVSVEVEKVGSDQQAVDRIQVKTSQDGNAITVDVPKPSGSITRALAETNRRRAKHLEFNATHGITPRSIRKAVTDVMEGARADAGRTGVVAGQAGEGAVPLGPEQAMKKIRKLEADMYRHARNLEFEEAARIRDENERLRQQAFGVPGQLAS